MYVLTKYGDELALVFSPDETVKLGDTILIDDILAQVVDIQFADLPGVLEHILRKSLIARSESEEHVQPELQSIVDSLADQKLARTKIRGRLVSDETNGKTHTSFKTGLSEFNISRVHSTVRVLPQDALFDSLNLTFPPRVILARRSPPSARTSTSSSTSSASTSSPA